MKDFTNTEVIRKTIVNQIVTIFPKNNPQVDKWIDEMNELHLIFINNFVKPDLTFNMWLAESNKSWLINATKF